MNITNRISHQVNGYDSYNELAMFIGLMMILEHSPLNHRYSQQI